jgi:hypothetical protein
MTVVLVPAFQNRQWQMHRSWGMDAFYQKGDMTNGRRPNAPFQPLLI